MLSDLTIYYNRYIEQYSNILDQVWTDHIYIENITGKSDLYTSPANYKYFFFIFYSIKIKMVFDSTYDWSNVMEDYDLADIVKKMYCHNIEFKDYLEIFEIPVSINDLNILITIDRIYFGLKDNDEVYVQTYKD